MAITPQIYWNGAQRCPNQNLHWMFIKVYLKHKLNVFSLSLSNILKITTTTMSRLDMILVTASKLSMCTKAEVDWTKVDSDHAGVQICVS